MDLDRDEVEYNTPEARSALINAPAWTAGLGLGTYPEGVPRALAEWLKRRGCAAQVTPSGGSDAPALVEHTSLALYGHVGAGKTGLGVCALRALAAAGVGSRFVWNMVTGPGLRAAVDSGEVQGLPSPCWFESWPRLLALHRRERWDEEGWFSLLEERVAALMLDDVGIDAGTPFRESFLLRHIEWASDVAGRCLVLTVNDQPGDWRRVFGERVVDRLADQRRFALVAVSTPGRSSLR